MRQEVVKTIRDYGMISRGDSVLVCVSGGADSVALLHILCACREELGIEKIRACHFNHGLRGESSDRDERLVAELCQRLGVELSVGHGHMNERTRPVGESVESWARALRYAFFEEQAARGERIAVAHNKNDLAETVLFNLARGTGLRGARGIPPVRGNIVRPLIGVTREKIERYCRENSLVYAVDETNLSDDYSRNRIRHNVLPELRAVNSAAVDNIARFAANAGRINAFIEQKGRELLSYAFISDGSYSAPEIVSGGELCARQALKLLCEDAGCDADETTVSLAYRVADGSLRELQLKDGLYLRLDNGRLCLRRQTEKADVPPPVKLRVGKNVFGDSVIRAEYASFPFTQFKKSLKFVLNNSFDCDKIVGIVTIRGRREGDAFSSSRRHNTKTLKKLFGELHIPAHLRGAVPVVCDDAGVVWLPGQGPDRRVACDETTKKIIYLTVEGES